MTSVAFDDCNGNESGDRLVPVRPAGRRDSQKRTETCDDDVTWTSAPGLTAAASGFKGNSET
jgi:hypothetical protein